MTTFFAFFFSGLAAGVLTKDINTALTFAQAVEAGSVW
jgi:aldehyde dehydrogenase (NAD+)